MAKVPIAGELAQEFELPDSTRTQRRLPEVISHGRLVLLFDRGNGDFSASASWRTTESMTRKSGRRARAPEESVMVPRIAPPELCASDRHHE